MTALRASPTQIESIQIVRGIAACLVVVDHFLHALVKLNPAYYQLNEIASQIGRVGVLVFFVISGYIMVATSYGSNGPRLNVIGFYWRRLKRILPIYWILTLFGAAIAARHIPDARLMAIWVVKSMLFLPVLSPDGTHMEPILGQGWTLYYEMMFYAVFGITLVLPRFLGVAVSAGLFISIAVADIVCRAIGEAPKLNHLVLFYSHYIILLFVGGMVIGIIEKKRARTNGIIRHPALISTALMTICIIHFYIFDRLTGLRPASEALYFVLATCVVAVCVFGDRITYRGAMATLVLVGEYSYAIYLTHNFFVYAYASALTHWVGGLNLPFFAPGIVVIAIIIGWLTFKVVEKPILTVLNRGLVRFNVNLRVVRLTSIFSRKDKGKD